MSDNRRDYGPRGCAEFALLPVLIALLMLLRRKGHR